MVIKYSEQEQLQCDKQGLSIGLKEIEKNLNDK